MHHIPDFLPHTKETAVFSLQTHMTDGGVLAVMFGDVQTVSLYSEGK